MRYARTAKSCGPDASRSASTWRTLVRPGTVSKKPDHRGEHEATVNHCAGKAGCFRRTCGDYACVLFSFAHKAAGASRARLSLRPLISGRDVSANLGRVTSRECGTVSLNVMARSACDEAIHTCFAARWIASLRSQ